MRLGSLARRCYDCRVIFAPLVFLWVVLLFIGLAFLFALIEVGAISYAFQQAGLPPHLAFVALFTSLLGSYVNIPISRIAGAGELRPHGDMVRYFGMRYSVPTHVASGTTVLAVNVGGAIVPVLIAAYLLAHQPESIVPALFAIAIVAIVVNRISRPVPGLGIATPMFIPPIVAALAGYMLAQPHHAGAVAFTGGVIGTLIGADLMNLRRIAGLGAPVASIGGAGTFDGIFLTGIVAVLLS